MEIKILVLNDQDNVGVILESAEKGDRCIHREISIEILESIEFVHKIAIVDIPEKDWVVKYGEDLELTARTLIAVGNHPNLGAEHIISN